MHLKNLLAKHGVSQTNLAAILGCDKSVVTNLFQGRRRLKADEATMIAEYLGVSVAAVMGRNESETSGFCEPPLLIPFQQAPKSGKKLSGVVKRGEKFFLETESADYTDKTYALEMVDNSMNMAGIMAGDILISDLDKKASDGQIVIAQHYNKSGAETIVRILSSPFLVARSTSPDFLPLHIEQDDVRVVSPVVKLIRSF